MKDTTNRLMSSPLKISYIVAVRNKAKTIAHCLSSLVKQHVDQVVVVDGRSSDGTSEIIDNFRVLHLYDRAEGLSIARNIGLAQCTGDYIVTLDGDEWVHYDFDRSLKLILATEEYDVVFCRMIPVGSSSWSKALQAEFVEVEAVRLQIVDDPFNHRPKVIKRSSLLRINGWDEEIKSLEDRDVWKKMELSRARFYMSNLIVYHDVFDVSALSEYKRGKWYGGSVSSYIKRYPTEWHKVLSVAPVGWILDIFFACRILVRTRNVKLFFLSLILRMARSVGWFMGILYAMHAG